MLTNCPECQLQISDKAVTCPHCGYPLKPNARQAISSKRKRLPNGFGQISYIKGQNLRNPYRAMVTVGVKPNGRPDTRPLKPVAYFKTYNEAYAALIEYNKSPKELEELGKCLEEVYEEWHPSHYKKLERATIAVYEDAWNKCYILHKLKISEIRSKDIRRCLDSCDKDSMKKRMKGLLNQLFDYAVECEYTDKNYARDTKYNLDLAVKNDHHAFKVDEVEMMWNKVFEMKYLDIILIQCYTGFRPQELGNIRLEDVNLKEWTIKGGMKTDAGKDRLVPIHEKIKGLVKTKYRVAEKLGSEYLFNVPMWNDPENVELMHLTYRRYNYLFKECMKELGLTGFKPHDPRKTFVTMAKRKGVDEYAIKLIVGHAIKDITERVYTERDIEWLRDEINKI